MSVRLNFLGLFVVSSDCFLGVEVVEREEKS